MKLIAHALDDLTRVSKEIIDFANQEKVWLFVGDMGSGKTTLIKAICQELQVTDHISSPTYSLVNEYLDAQNNTIHHFDLYRLNDENEALEIGVEDILYSGNLCLVEWPDKIPSLIPDKYVEISIILGEGNQRKFNIIRK